jgi:hypothetical protein
MHAHMLKDLSTVGRTKVAFGFGTEMSNQLQIMLSAIVSPIPPSRQTENRLLKQSVPVQCEHGERPHNIPEPPSTMHEYMLKELIKSK